MKLTITPTIRSALEAIAPVVDDGKPDMPTLYALWESGEPIGRTLDMPRSEWVKAIGSLLAWGEADEKAIERLMLQAGDPAFVQDCLAEAGVIAK